jgi:hypothetical protein
MMKVLIGLLLFGVIALQPQAQTKHQASECGYPIYVEPGTRVGFVEIEVCTETPTQSSPFRVTVYRYSNFDNAQIAAKRIFSIDNGAFGFVSNYGEMHLQIDEPGFYGFEIFWSGHGFVQTVYIGP